MFGTPGSRAGKGGHLHGLDIKLVSPGTQNTYANSSGVFVGNSSVNTHLTTPTSGQYSATNYFLHANGSWVQVTGGAASGVVRIYQAFTATGGQVDFTVSGGYTVNQIDVYYNGDHLANTEYTQDGSNVSLVVAALNGAVVEVVGYSNLSVVNVSSSAGGSNTQVQYNDSAAFGGSAGFTFDKASNIVVIANTLNVAIVSQGNSTANYYGNSTYATIVNSTAQANLTPIGLSTGTSTVNTTAIAAGANIVINTTAIFMGNSTVNSVTNSTAEVVQNSTVVSIYGIGVVNVGANVALDTTDLQIGNSTANLLANSVLVTITNSTAQANLSPATLVIGGSTVNSTAYIAGANVFIDTTKLSVGNSTANLLANSILVTLANSTATANLSPATLVIGSATVNSTAHLSGANVFLDTVKLSIGNTIANLTANSILVQVANATGTCNVQPNTITVGNSTVFTVIGTTANIVGTNTHLLGTSSVAGNGYTWLFNGVLLQWGWVNANTSKTTATFPVAFPTTCFAVIATSNVGNTTAGAAVVLAQNTTVANIVVQAGTANVHYIALGN